MDLTTLYSFGKALAGPLTVNLGGWFKNSLEDGVLQSYEIKQGLKTFVEVSVKTAIVYFGLGGILGSMGLGIDPFVSSFIGAFWQMIENYIKAKKEKVQVSGSVSVTKAKKK